MSSGWTDLAMVVAAHDYERVHYALVIAATAAALDKRVTLLFTLGALAALKQVAAEGGPGWHALPSPTGAPAAALDAAHHQQGVATLEELFESCAALGVRFLACEMALRQQRLTVDDLRTDLRVEAAGVAALLAGVGGEGKLMTV